MPEAGPLFEAKNETLDSMNKKVKAIWKKYIDVTFRLHKSNLSRNCYLRKKQRQKLATMNIKMNLP